MKNNAGDDRTKVEGKCDMRSPDLDRGGGLSLLESMRPAVIPLTAR